MSRAIKFRVWDSQYSCWHSIGVPLVVTNDDIRGWHVGEARFQGNPCIDAPSDPDGFAKYSRARYVLEQFTGLLDKNGREIYEGDIAKVTNLFNHISSVGEVKFICFGWYITCGEGHHSEPMHSPDRFKIEVIGNVHENGALIKP